MSDITHMHDETKDLPVKKHNEMLSKQFFLGATRSTELTITLNYKGFNRNISPTLEHKFKPDIEHLLNENQENISKLEYVNGIKNLHTTELQNFLNEKSKLLGRILPTLSPNDSKLDRKTQFTSPASTTGLATIYPMSAQVAT